MVRLSMVHGKENAVVINYYLGVALTPLIYYGVEIVVISLQGGIISNVSLWLPWTRYFSCSILICNVRLVQASSCFLGLLYMCTCYELGPDATAHERDT